MRAGGLVPNEVVQEVLEDYLVQNVRQGRTYFLVDGFPRSLEQADAFKRRVSISAASMAPLLFVTILSITGLESEDGFAFPRL